MHQGKIVKVKGKVSKLFSSGVLKCFVLYFSKNDLYTFSWKEMDEVLDAEIA